MLHHSFPLMNSFNKTEPSVFLLDLVERVNAFVFSFFSNKCGECVRFAIAYKWFNPPPPQKKRSHLPYQGSYLTCFVEIILKNIEKM